MHIVRIQINNFRSIDAVTIDATQLLVFCGYNSAGKSNVLNALRVAFRDGDMTQSEIYDNLPSGKRDAPGGPTLSIWIDVIFGDVPQELLEFSGQPTAKRLTYKFRAIRNGTRRRSSATRSVITIEIVAVQHLMWCEAWPAMMYGNDRTVNLQSLAVPTRARVASSKLPNRLTLALRRPANSVASDRALRALALEALAKLS